MVVGRSNKSGPVSVVATCCGVTRDQLLLMKVTVRLLILRKERERVMMGCLLLVLERALMLQSEGKGELFLCCQKTWLLDKATTITVEDG